MNYKGMGMHFPFISYIFCFLPYSFFVAQLL